MKVTLISCTPDALNLLLRTKNTRLTHADDPAGWSEEKKQEHLEYMLDTIRSSYEFVDYIFQIDGVTRVFTHQLVRTRTGSYAQQAQRVADVRDNPIEEPPNVANKPALHDLWAEGIEAARKAYGGLVDAGVAIQDARGILPQHLTTSITAKFNLRTLSDTAKLRLCTRTQGEYQDIFRRMRELIIEVHPWAAPFLEVHCVATGTCAFPRYGKVDCPVYLPEMDNGAVRERARAKFWAVRHESVPRAKDGKSQ